MPRGIRGSLWSTQIPAVQLQCCLLLGYRGENNEANGTNSRTEQNRTTTPSTPCSESCEGIKKAGTLTEEEADTGTGFVLGGVTVANEKDSADAARTLVTERVDLAVVAAPAVAG